MAKQIRITTECDWEDCGVSDADLLEGESGEIRPVDFLVYVRGRGRKSQPITIDLCPLHVVQMKNIYQALSKFDQNKAV